MNPQDPYQPQQAPALQHSPPPQPQQQTPPGPVLPPPTQYAQAPQATPPAPQVTQIPQPTLAPGTPPITSSVDYLNQIAAPPMQKTVNKFAVFGLIFGGIILAAFGAFLMSGGMKPSNKEQANAIQERIITLQTVTKDHQSHLNANVLSSANVTLNASLTSINTEIIELTGVKKIEASKKSKNKKEIAHRDALASRLEDAYLTGTLDRVYSTEMAYQLALLKGQLQKFRTSSGSKAANEFYEKNAATLDATIKLLSEFSADK